MNVIRAREIKTNTFENVNSDTLICCWYYSCTTFVKYLYVTIRHVKPGAPTGLDNERTYMYV